MYVCVMLLLCIMQQFRGGKSDYHVRTDDGEHICTYIEAYQKNPDKAVVRMCVCVCVCVCVYIHYDCMNVQCRSGLLTCTYITYIHTYITGSKYNKCRCLLK